MAKKVETTTLHYKHEFYVDRVSHGKAYLIKAGTPIRQHKTHSSRDSKLLRWMDRRDAKALAKKNGWTFEDC